MSDTQEHPLTSELDHWIDVTRLRYQQFLEALTALELKSARRHFELFSRLLLSAIEFSSARLEDILGGEKGDEDTGMIRADHMILRRSLPQVTDALDQLDNMDPDKAANLRSAMVERLDTFVRVANILARHQDRSWEIMGPRIEQYYNRSEGQELAEQLSSSMQRAQPN